MNKWPIPDAALEHHIAILGKTGSGKSTAAAATAERLIAGKRRVCIIDPTDRYWGLRLMADGKTPSPYEPVIFGGAHADMPLSDAHGAAVAEVVGTTTTPVIISTRDMTVGARTRFFADFAEALLRKNEGPLHLIIDEAHLFAPQARVMSPDSSKMLHAANNLVSLGRGVGLRIMLLSQRPAKLHKDSLTQAETLIAFRLIAPQDRNAIREWVSEWADPATGAEMMSSLPSLPTGTAWLWAPELDMLSRVEFPLVSTYDSGRPAPVGKGPALRPIDLAAVRGRLEVVAKEAVENDPRRLKARIAELERAAKTAPAPDPAAIERAWNEGHDQGKAETAAHYSGQLTALRAAVEAALGYLAPFAKTENEGAIPIVDIRHAPAPPIIDHRPAAAALPRRAPAVMERTPGRATPPPARDGAITQGITGPQQRILDALAWWLSAGVSTATRIQVAVVAGYRPGSGNFNNLLGALNGAGLISYPAAGMVALADAGAAVAAPVDIPPDTAALHDKIFGILAEPQRRVLRPVLDAYPDPIDRRAIAEAAQYQSGSGNFNNLLGSLRSLGLIHYPAPGLVAAEPMLFIDA